MAAKDKAETGAPRASSAKLPQRRACRVTDHTSWFRACPNSTRVELSPTSDTGDASLNASPPDLYALGTHSMYGAMLVSLRVLFERHRV